MTNRKWFTIGMIICITLNVLAGCGNSGQNAGTAMQDNAARNETLDSDEETSSSGTGSTVESIEESDGVEASGMVGKVDTDNTQNKSAAPDSSPYEAGGDVSDLFASNNMDGVSFVMIYDPLVYDEQDETQIAGTTLNTGDLSSQIMTGMNRAGGMQDLADVPVLMSQAQINKGLSLDMGQRSGARAGGLHPVYTKGDTHDFYSSAGSLSMEERTLETFECMYAGDACYIWSYEGSVSEEDAEILGREFDEVIFPKDEETFGEPRFTEIH